MNRSDPLIEKYYSLKPSKYGFLERFCLTRKIDFDNFSSFCLELQLCSPLDHQCNERLQLSFSGIKELSIGNLEGLFSLLIDLKNIQDSQLENIKYQVVESEYNSFSFLCSNIKVTLLKLDGER